MCSSKGWGDALQVISDLLKPERHNLTIKEDKKRGVFVDGLSEWVVRSPQEVRRPCSNADLWQISRVDHRLPKAASGIRISKVAELCHTVLG